MKKFLGLVTAAGLIGSAVPTVVACNSQKPDSFYKKSLKISIDKAEETIRVSPEKNEDKAIPLKEELKEAKNKYQKQNAEEEEYIVAKYHLDTQLNEFLYPGYIDAKDWLKNLIAETEEDIATDNSQIKLPYIIKGLKRALIEAKTALKEETDPSIIKLVAKKLEFWKKAYWLNRTEKINEAKTSLG